MHMKTSFKPFLTLIAVALLLLMSTTAAVASHWSECHFELVIVDISETHLTIDPRRFIRGDGSGMMDERSCLKKVGERKIPVEDVADGIGLLGPGARLQGRWFEYGAMTPEGPVLHRGWSFTPSDQP